MTTSPAAPSDALSLPRRWAALRARRWFRWTTDGLFFLAILTAVTAFQTRDHLGSGPVPEFSLQTLDGQQVRSAGLAGKPTLIAFWAPWCPVCKVESRNLSWARKLVGDRARVVSIAAAYDDVAAVRRYVADQGVDYPVLLGGEAQTRDFHVQGFPTVYFLDAGGRVKGSVVGYTTTLGLVARLLW